jgi:hypothetical protein
MDAKFKYQNQRYFSLIFIALLIALSWKVLEIINIHSQTNQAGHVGVKKQEIFSGA